jgi:hypothetical protein
MDRIWEDIAYDHGSDGTEQTSRMKVPGGWIVRTKALVIEDFKQVAISEAMVYVPDPSHDWVVVKVV